MKNSDGFSLLELLMALTITTISLTLSIPYFNAAYRNFQTVKDVNLLLGALQAARSVSVFQRHTVTICSLDANNQCSGQWDNIVVYSDYDENGVLNTPDQIIIRLDDIQDKATLNWSAFGSTIRLRSQMIQYQTTGWLNNQNGSWYYCVEDAPERSRRIVINRQGRGRIERLSNYEEKCQ